MTEPIHCKRRHAARTTPSWIPSPAARRWLGACLLFLPFAALASVTLQGRVIANGGTTHAQGGSYRLAGTIGEPAAGTAAGGALQLDSGFWQPARVVLPDLIFSDGFED